MSSRDGGMEVQAALDRTTGLQDSLRESIYRLTMHMHAPDAQQPEAENEHESLVAVRSSLDSLDSTIRQLQGGATLHHDDKVELLQTLERTRHELYALASRALRRAVREKDVLYEVLDFVELKDETDTVDPYTRDVYSTPPSAAADGIVGRKDKVVRQSPTSVLFPESHDMMLGPGGMEPSLAEDPRAADYFDRRERGGSPAKEAARSPHGRGRMPGLPPVAHQVWDLSAASPSMGGVDMGLGGAYEGGHRRRRSGGLLGLIKWGIIFGGVGAVLQHFRPRGVNYRKLGMDISNIAHDGQYRIQELIHSVRAHIRRLQGKPQKGGSRAAAARASQGAGRSSRPAAHTPPLPEWEDPDLLDLAPSSMVRERHAGGLGVKQPFAQLPVEPLMPVVNLHPDIFVGQG